MPVGTVILEIEHLPFLTSSSRIVLSEPELCATLDVALIFLASCNLCFHSEGDNGVARMPGSNTGRLEMPPSIWNTNLDKIYKDLYLYVATYNSLHSHNYLINWQRTDCVYLLYRYRQIALTWDKQFQYNIKVTCNKAKLLGFFVEIPKFNGSRGKEQNFVYVLFACTKCINIC